MKLIGAEGARLLENAHAFSSCGVISWKYIQCPEGSAGQVRPRSEARRLTARPSESEQPFAEINLTQLLKNSNKLYEKSVMKNILKRESINSCRNNSCGLFIVKKFGKPMLRW
ncbi:hypothetical protein D9X91_05505 [Falsibacillus albus]|uniref:Uncharacterized protein n=1 Tax=Falsibacillus albus TaxID=2478915 RepID=A0A3L7K765_9BACI|nr:hypothetical protein D9X91_05505 [Falsibacillus albus]